jgi:hypothetical protein
LDDVVERPYMLDDIRVEAQRLSAVLPLDGWAASHKPTRLERQPSGVFNLVRYPGSDDEEDSS